MLMLKKIFATTYQYTQTIKQSNNQTIKQSNNQIIKQMLKCLSMPTNDHQCLKIPVNACSMLIDVEKSLKNFAHVYQCLLLMNTALEQQHIQSTLPLSAKLYQALLHVAASLRWITPRCSYCYGSASTADEWPVNPPSSILLNSAVAMLQRFNIPMSPRSSPLFETLRPRYLEVHSLYVEAPLSLNLPWYGFEIDY